MENERSKNDELVDAIEKILKPIIEDVAYKVIQSYTLHSKTLMTDDEVADRLSLHKQTVYKYVRKGLLNPIRLNGRTLRFRVDEIERIEHYGILPCPDSNLGASKPVARKRKDERLWVTN